MYIDFVEKISSQKCDCIVVEGSHSAAKQAAVLYFAIDQQASIGRFVKFSPNQGLTLAGHALFVLVYHWVCLCDNIP